MLRKRKKKILVFFPPKDVCGPKYEREIRPRMKKKFGLVVNDLRKLQKNFREVQDFLIGSREVLGLTDKKALREPGNFTHRAVHSRGGRHNLSPAQKAGSRCAFWPGNLCANCVVGIHTGPSPDPYHEIVFPCPSLPPIFMVGVSCALQ